MTTDCQTNQRSQILAWRPENVPPGNSYTLRSCRKIHCLLTANEGNRQTWDRQTDGRETDRHETDRRTDMRQTDVRQTWQTDGRETDRRTDVRQTVENATLIAERLLHNAGWKIKVKRKKHTLIQTLHVTKTEARSTSLKVYHNVLFILETFST